MRPTILIPLLLSFLLVVVGCSDDDPSSPQSDPPRVLVLSDDGTEVPVAEILEEAGMEVRVGGNWWEDAGDSLYTYDAVLLLTGYDYSHEMSEAAQVRLTQYVASGGGLLSTEWFAYYSYRNPILAEILPVLQNRDYDYEAETYRPQGDHPVLGGLPAVFQTGPDWTWNTLVPDTNVAERAEVVLEGDIGGPAVVTGVHGRGRTCHWGMAGVYNGDDIWTSGVERLLINMVAWIAR